MHVLNFTPKYKQIKLNLRNLNRFAAETQYYVPDVQSIKAHFERSGKSETNRFSLAGMGRTGQCLVRTANALKAITIAVVGGKSIFDGFSIVRYHRSVANESALANRMGSFLSTQNRPLLDD
jgi:hypothetical protein